VFLLDAAKRPRAFFRTLSRFAPGWRAGLTVVGFMDLFHYRFVNASRARQFVHQARFLDAFGDAFEILQGFPDDEPVFARYCRSIDFAKLEEACGSSTAGTE
jgi:hypothetical protein